MENGDQIDDDSHSLDNAAASGNLGLFVWLHQNTNAMCSAEAMDCAAEYNHLHVARWLCENRIEGCTTHAMDSAASSAIVEVLHTNRSGSCTTPHGYLRVVH